jgi:hypothetical protein
MGGVLPRQVLHGCPWLLPKAVYVLALQGRSADCEADIRSTYTLRTKIKQEGAADALAKVTNFARCNTCSSSCQL